MAAEPASLEAPLPAAPEVPIARAAALGEGAARAVPLGPPAGRGRGADRAVRDRLLGRAEGRIARRPADRGRRDRDRRPDGDHQDAARRWPWRRSRTSRAPSRSSSSRGSTSRRRRRWQEGAILLVAGRIDHRGEEVSLLADLVTDLDAAVEGGEEAFAAEVAAGDRGRPRGPAPGAETATAARNGHASAGASPGPRRRPGPAPPDAARSAARAGCRPAGRTPPRRRMPPRPRRRAPPPEPVAGSLEPADLEAVAPDREEPALPDEARAAALGAAAAPTEPREAGPAAASTSGSRPASRPTTSRRRWPRSATSCAAAPAPRASRSTCRRDRDARRSRWSCGPASPPTRELARRGLAALRPGLSTCALASDPEARAASACRSPGAERELPRDARSRRQLPRGSASRWRGRRTTESCSRCSERIASKSAGSISSSLAIWFSVGALGGGDRRRRPPPPGSRRAGGRGAAPAWRPA